MKVLLKEDVYNLGAAGEVHTVAPGYGRNYLIPKNLAVKATPSTLKQAEVWRKKAEARRNEMKAEYAALSARINEVTLNFTARAGESGRLYGSITTAQITDELNAALGTEVDRRKVGDESLRQLGTHKVMVRLSGEFQPELTVIIKPEESVDEAEVAESEPVAAVENEAEEAEIEVESAADAE